MAAGQQVIHKPKKLHGLSLKEEYKVLPDQDFKDIDVIPGEAQLR